MRLLYYFWNNLSRISSIFKISIFKILSTNSMKQISANQKFWYCKIIFSSTTPMLFSKGIFYEGQRSRKFVYLYSKFVYSISDEATYYTESAMLLSLEKHMSFGSFVNKG